MVLDLSDIHLQRKVDHINICLRDDVVHENNCEELFSEIVLVHQAFPRISYHDVDITTKFLGYEMSAPIVIEAITGGYPQAKLINEKLATLANEYGLAIAVGSQRPILASNFNNGVVETYRVARDKAPNVPLIGNIGITQLRDIDVDVAKSLVDCIQADALAIHLNPAQELVQPEGDKNFREDLLERVSQLVRELGVPIIVKEVGHGLSMETVTLFKEIGVRIFDTAGACGTNWIKVEAYRNPEGSLAREVGFSLSSLGWGIPTPISLIEVKTACPSGVVIASGGVWNGVYAAKMLALGGDLVGFARPILKALINHGYEGAKRYLEKYITELKAVFFLVGARNLKELRAKPLILGAKLRDLLTARGINVEEYIARIRRGDERE